MNATVSTGVYGDSGLLCHSDSPSEAVISVANVQRFMAMALSSYGKNGGITNDELDGIRIILETCADTLDFHFRAGGVVTAAD